MSTSGSSRSPTPQILPKKKKSGAKDKGKQKAALVPARSEGVDPHWTYAPPSGSVLVDNTETDAGGFDWDAVNDNDDVELWLIRIPDAVKPKHLENLKIDLPTSSTSACIGTLKRKQTSYDIWSVGDDDNQPIGGEEIKGISCLLPRKSKKGRLYPASKPIVHHLVMAAQPVVATPPGTKGEASISYKNTPRQSYPSEVLKHRFMPYGSLTNMDDTSKDVPMAEAEPLVEESSPSSKKKPKTIEEAPVVEVEEQELKRAKGKKRKGDAIEVIETPVKKPKKSKAA